MCITLDQVREAQRASPDSEKTKEMQRQYDQQLDEDRRQREATAALAAQRTHDDACHRLTYCAPRKTAVVWGWCDQDDEWTAKRVHVVGCRVIEIDEDGEAKLAIGDTREYVCRVRSWRRGAFYSSGCRSGWWIRLVVELPEDLQTWSILEVAY